MPQAKPRLLDRTHITETLLSAVEEFPLVVLTAPMGYGKTTAARELMRATYRRVFSITVDPGGHNAAYLWNRACEQLSQQGAEFGKMFQNMSFSEDPVMQRRTLSWAREHLKDKPTLLVIDDCHLIRDQAIEAYIDLLTRESIPNLNVLMLSRTRPNLPLEELRLKGLARHFSQDLLVFSEEEAASFFTLHGVADKDASRQAWNFSEGWAAAIWLSLHSYQATEKLHPVEDMEQLMQSAVFSHYSLEDQILLLQLSILDSFSPHQASMISGDQHAPRRLRLLQAQNAFMPYDAGLNSYRLHSIFRSFLRRRLDEQCLPAAQAVDRTALYRRAGEWCVQEKDIMRAVHFFALAGEDEDYLRILQTFCDPAAGFSVLHDPEGILRVMRSIPWPVLDRCPIGYLAFVFSYLSKVNQHEGRFLLREVEEYLERADKAALYESVRGELELIKGVSSFNDLEKATAHYEKAAGLLKEPSQIYTRRMLWNLGCPHTAFLFLREPGGYEKLVELMETRGRFYQKISDGCGSGLEDLARAEYLLETGSLRQVEPLLMKSIYRAGSKGQLATILSVRFTQARLLLCQGQAQQAWELFDNMQVPVMTHGNPLLTTSLDLCQGYLATVSCQPGQIPEWLRQGDWGETHGFYQAMIFMHIVHGRWLLMEKNWPRLEALAQDIPNAMGHFNFLFGHIHAQVMLAAALGHAQQKKDSREAMRRAVELCRPDGIMLSVAEYGSHVSPLLRSLSRENPADKFVAALYRLSARYDYQQAAPRPAVKLTEREQEILTRAIAGDSNQEIARALRVQPVTIGNALTRIYKKLGAQSRVEASNIWRNMDWK